MISHSGRGYQLVTEGMKKPRELGCRGFFAIGDGGERVVLDQEAFRTSRTSSISTIICLMIWWYWVACSTLLAPVSC